MSDHETERDIVSQEAVRLAKVLEDFRASLLSPHEMVVRVEEALRSFRQAVGHAGPEDRIANLKRLLRELDALPVQNPDDGFSSRDHDDELYREPR